MAKKPDINDVERPPKKCFGEKLYYSKDFLGPIWLDIQLAKKNVNSPFKLSARDPSEQLIQQGNRVSL